MNRSRSRTLLHWTGGLALLLALGCSGDTPTAPVQTPNPGPGTQPTTTWRITLTANPNRLLVGSTQSSVISVQVRRADNNQAPPAGTTVVLTTTLGEFDSFGSGQTSGVVVLSGGNAQVLLFPGNVAGNAVVQARLESSVGQTTVLIETFFISRIEPTVGDAAGGETVTVFGQGFVAPVRVEFGAVPAQTVSVATDRVVVITPPSPTPNVDTVVDVRVTNDVGGAGQAIDTLNDAFRYLGNPAATFFVSHVSPNRGRASGGQQVTIFGGGFEEVVRVFFGALPAQVLSVAATQIVVITPATEVAAGGELAVDVSVTINLNEPTAQTDTLPSAFIFEADAGTTFFISSVDPPVGEPAGGETVRILGGGFEGPFRVTFGGIPAQVVSSSRSRITVITPPATVPAGSTLSVAVSVTINLNETGEATDTLPAGFTYAFGSIDDPVILSISPASGPNEGGTTVRIVGSGFVAPVQVFFGEGTEASFSGVEATVLNVTSNEIVVRSPAATGFGQDNRNQLVDILVRNLDSGRADVFEEAFQYGVPVIITAMGPTRGPFTGGTLVTLHGQGFDEPVAVAFANTGGQSVISVTGTQIVFRTVGIPTPDCDAEVDAGAVSVTNIETGDSASGPGFTFDGPPSPQILGVSPNTGTGAGNTTVTITGINFEPPVRVSFEDILATVVSATSTTIVVRTPPFNDFEVQACDDNGDGQQGERFIPTSVTVTVENVGNACDTEVEGGFTYTPTDVSCRGDVAPVTPPVAAFTSTTLAANAVAYTDQSTGNPVSWLWDFDIASALDAPSSQQNPTHTFPAPGTYNTRLTVTNAGGSSSVVNPVTAAP